MRRQARAWAAAMIGCSAMGGCWPGEDCEPFCEEPIVTLEVRRASWEPGTWTVEVQGTSFEPVPCTFTVDEHLPSEGRCAFMSFLKVQDDGSPYVLFFLDGEAPPSLTVTATRDGAPAGNVQVTPRYERPSDTCGGVCEAAIAHEVVEL